MNQQQLLKATGHFTNVTLDDIKNAMIQLPAELLGRSERCLCPDFGDEEIADADPDRVAASLGCDEDTAAGLITAHSRMVGAAQGSGSWPAGCDASHPSIHTVHVFLDMDTFRSHYTRPVTDEELGEIDRAGVWRWSREQIFQMWAGKSMVEVSYDLCVETYRLAGIKLLSANSRSDCNIHIRNKPLRGSTIGIAWFNNGTCDDVVDNHIDTGYQPDLQSCAILLAHELGHNMNLEHEFWQEARHKSIMSYTEPDNFYGFSTGEKPHVLPRDRSWDELIDYFGGAAVPLDEDTGGDEPPTTPPTGELAILGTLNVEYQGETIGRVQVVPIDEF